MRKFLLFVCLFALTALSAAAQNDDLPEGCDAAGAVTVIAELAADSQLSPLDILRAIRDAVNEVLIDCEGLTFTSEEEGTNPALGPVTLEEGLWRVTVETSGTMFLDLTPLDGTCAGTGNLASVGTLFMIVQPGDGAETLIESEGCDALFEFSMASASWEMTLEKLR